VSLSKNNYRDPDGCRGLLRNNEIGIVEDVRNYNLVFRNGRSQTISGAEVRVNTNSDVKRQKEESADDAESGRQVEVVGAEMKPNSEERNAAADFEGRFRRMDILRRRSDFGVDFHNCDAVVCRH